MSSPRRTKAREWRGPKKVPGAGYPTSKADKTRLRPGLRNPDEWGMVINRSLPRGP